MSNTNPGMMYPTAPGMVGANPADSARVSMLNKGQMQASANKLMAGGKLKRMRMRYGGAAAASSIVVPQYPMLYEAQGNGPNTQIQSNSQTSTQMSANSVYDSDASILKKGGKKSRKGGNSDWVWGCMSGGKRKSRRSHKKYKKSRRSHKKSRKH